MEVHSDLLAAERLGVRSRREVDEQNIIGFVNRHLVPVTVTSQEVFAGYVTNQEHFRLSVPKKPLSGGRDIADLIFRS